ncbi:MAG: endo-1,4-beta-xylanase [Bryobacterales bacterium]
MKITGQGFQVLLLVAVSVAGSKRVVDRWPLYPESGLAVGSEQVENQTTRFAAPNSGGRDEAAAPWTLRQTRREGSAPSLRQTGGPHGLAVGTAVEPGFLAAGSVYRSAVSHEFSTLTPENVMKFDHIHPAHESNSFCDSAALFSCAAANHIQVRGQTLVWHQQLPEWLSRGEFSGQQQIAIERGLVHTVAGRCHHGKPAGPDSNLPPGRRRLRCGRSLPLDHVLGLCRHVLGLYRPALLEPFGGVVPEIRRRAAVGDRRRLGRALHARLGQVSR